MLAGGVRPRADGRQHAGDERHRGDQALPLRRARPRARCPIVALTADATPEARSRCKEAGMDACATKPIEPAELFRIIDRLVPEEAGEPRRAAVDDGGGRTPSPRSPRIRASGQRPRAIDVAHDRGTARGSAAMTSSSDLANGSSRRASASWRRSRQAAIDGDVRAVPRPAARAAQRRGQYRGAVALSSCACRCAASARPTFADEGSHKARQIEAEFARVRSELGESYRKLAGSAASPTANATQPAPRSGLTSAVTRPPASGCRPFQRRSCAAVRRSILRRSLSPRPQSGVHPDIGDVAQLFVGQRRHAAPRAEHAALRIVALAAALSM